MKRNLKLTTEDGTVFRGVLHSRSGAAAPGIVMAHGFSGVKEQVEHYAAAFAAAGFSVLLHDHRGFGASAGEPRREVNHAHQLADWRDAITFALTQSEFDADARVGAWGSSFAGGLSIVLGAIDARVRCVVAQIPHVAGGDNGRRMFNATQRHRLQKAFATDRAARHAGGAPARVPVLSEDPDALVALPPVTQQRHIERAEELTPWRNEVTLRSVENMMEFERAAWIRHVSPKPLMMIVAANDVCTFTEIQLNAFEAAREPKRLVVQGGDHWDTYTTHFSETSEAATAWFTEHPPLPARQRDEASSVIA